MPSTIRSESGAVGSVSGAVLMLIAVATTGARATTVGAECADPVVCLRGATPEYQRHHESMSRAVLQNWALLKPAAEQRLGAPGDTYYHSSGDTDNCRQITTVKQPTVLVLTKDSSTHNVVQLDRFQQQVNWTECLPNQPRQKCFTGALAAGVEARCDVKYGAISLYVYVPEHDELRYQTFPLPVGCVCRFRKTSR